MRDLPPRAGALPWTDAVIHETMRLFPPVWATSRGAAEAGVLQARGHEPVELRAGTVLLLGIHAMHRDPARWAHPDAFDPERWLHDPDEGGVRGMSFPELPYVPFGAGQRKCIGSHFALLEARIALATLVSAVDVRLMPGQRIEEAPRVTLRPNGPVWVTSVR